MIEDSPAKNPRHRIISQDLNLIHRDPRTPPQIVNNNAIRNQQGQESQESAIINNNEQVGGDVMFGFEDSMEMEDVVIS